MEKLQIMRSSPDHDELVELYKKEKNSKIKERYHALILMLELRNCRKVSEIIKKSTKTIQNWVNMFNMNGIDGIIPNSPPGRPSRLSNQQKELLKTDVLTHPRELGYDFSNWEGKSVSEHIKNRFGILLKVRQCQYILHKMGFSLQRPRHSFPKANKEVQEEFIHDIKKRWMLLDPKK
jgi:putative transposase